MSRSRELIVSGKYLLTMDADNNVLDNGALLIRGNTIAKVGDAGELIADYPQAERLNEPHGLIMPGLINTHTHVGMSCFSGLADDLPLMEWLQEYIFPREAQLSGEIVYQSTLLSLCEMIKSGITSFSDMYLFTKDIARAVHESGMRGWLGEGFFDFPSPGYGKLENGFIYMDELFDLYNNHELITITVSPHSVYTCSPELLTRLGRFRDTRQAIYHIHLSENHEEVQTCQKQYGCTPVQHLEKLGLLDSRVLAAHCVILDDTDMELLAKKRVKVAHCLQSNMKLASGIAPLVRMADSGICISLGTDGPASNNGVDMFAEMNSVAKVHKAVCMEPTVMDDTRTIRAATIGGAAALSASDMIGSLEEGKKADCIVIDLNQPHLTPVYNPVSHMVYAARGSDVIHSIINGRHIMKNRKITTLDENCVLAGMNIIRQTILDMG